MPYYSRRTTRYRRRYGRRYRRRPYYRRRVYRGRRRSYRAIRKSSASRAPLRYRDYLFTKLRADASYVIDNTPASSNPYFFKTSWSGNDPYKVSASGSSGGTNVARDYDFWWDKYQRMTCLASKVRLTVFSSGSNAQSVNLYLWPSFEASPTNNAELAPVINSPNVRTVMLPINNSVQRTLKFFKTTKSLYACTNVFDDSSFRTVYQSNPTVPWFWHFCFGNFDPNTLSNMKFTFKFRITYYVAYHRKVQAPY